MSSTANSSLAILIARDPEAAALAEAILTAAGSSLRHYMPVNQDRLVAEARAQIDKIRGQE
ncbi:hypothetical protein [Paenirhodobacter enshiensis]|uniref:hypothetical protein n=1 Tax=Paenirhodobacter enshiensis TaxID=1105367 RepID=UPI0035B48FB4